jgi:glycosyltransferase involved in cell wall biosynthesis
MKPKVTVGVCVKNSAITIKEAMESIINQDFPHELLELIVVDGNSKDETLMIIEKCLKGANIKTKIFSENEGLGWARQIVVENAQGDYIVWVDGDMVLQKDYIRRLVEFMEQNPNIGIAKGKPSLKLLKGTLATLENFSRAVNRMADFQSKSSHSKTLGTSGSIYRVNAIRQVGGFDKDIQGYCEDWDAEIKVQSAGWARQTIDIEYLDYERHGVTWKALWRRYWRRGYDTHFFLHKRPGLIKHYRMLPPAAFLAGLLDAHKLFILSRKKMVFLLPIQYIFKSAAWYAGFLKGHQNFHEAKQQ